MIRLQQITEFLYQSLMVGGSFLCHQKFERSPLIFGLQMPLCWRCSGITIGAICFFIWLIFRGKQPAIFTSILLASLMLIDVLTAMLGFWNGDNFIRFLTGWLWGIFGMNIVLDLMKRAVEPNFLQTFSNFIKNENGR